MKKEVYNYGIGMLKIIAMLFIIILHINARGGIITNSNNHPISYILEIIALCSVNVYAIITGYLEYRDNENNTYQYNFKKIFNLYFIILFYGLIIYLISYILGVYEFNKNDIFNLLFPISSKYLWYFTAYAGTFIFFPIINKFVKNSDKKHLIYYSIVIIIIFSLWPSLFSNRFGDFWNLKSGYSVWWLLILYFLGAVVKKINLKIDLKKLFVMLLILYFTSWVWTCYSAHITNWIFGQNKFEGIFNSYISITSILIAIIYVLIFSNLKFPKKINKATKFLAPATFGVYVMHLHPIVWQYWKDRFLFILNYNILLEPILVLIIAVLLLILMLLIDKVRECIFKLCKINNISSKLNNITNKIIISICKIIEKRGVVNERKE